MPLLEVFWVPFKLNEQFVGDDDIVILVVFCKAVEFSFHGLSFLEKFYSIGS